MNFFSNIPLINCVGTKVRVQRVLQNKNTIIFYFSSSNCPFDEQLVYKLKNLYKVIKNNNIGLEIIYVPCDTNVEIVMNHFKENHHGWYAIPPCDYVILELQLMFNVTFIPQIVVVRVDGTIITTKGTKDLNELGNDVIIKWSEPYCR